MLEFQRVEAESGTVCHRHAGTDRRATDVAQQATGTDVVEEPRRDALQGEHRLVAGIAEGQDRLTAVLGDDRVQTLADLGERLVPGDAFELTRPLRSDAAQGMQQTIGVVHAVEETVDLRAQFAGRVRMIGVAAQGDRRAGVVDLHHPSARVGAVVMAYAVDGPGVRLDGAHLRII